MISDDEDRLLVMLAQHPGWKVLGKLAEHKIREKERVVQRQIMSKEPADQRAIDFTRGFRAGCMWIMDIRQPDPDMKG